MPTNNSYCYDHVTARPCPDLPSDSAASLPPAPPPQTKRNPKFLALLLQTLIMVSVISLFLVFVGVAAIIVVHLCIAGGTLHRRRRRHHQQQPPQSSGTPTGHSLEELKKGLPRTLFRGAEEGGSKSRELCAICLEFVLEGEWCGFLPDCKHLFHSNCVEKWLLKVPSCPVCRSPVVLNSVPASLAGGHDDCGQLWAAVFS
ncbi:hypothetical protein Dimus_025757 [Dionaea muscipula]